MKRLVFVSIAFLLACSGRGRGGPVTASGYIEATDVRIATKVSGRVEKFALREGDRLKAGDLVAQIEIVDYRLALDTAKAERDQFEADLAGATRDFRRMQELFQAGSGTAKSRDDAQTRMNIAGARLAGAKARIAQIEQQIADTTIKSPVTGVLTEKLVEEGEIVSAGTALAVATDLARPWLTVFLPEPDLPRVRLGDEAEARTDAGSSRRGKVTFIATTAEFTPKNVQTRDERVKLVYKVKIGLENSDGLFKPGMPADAVFVSHD